MGKKKGILLILLSIFAIIAMFFGVMYITKTNNMKLDSETKRARTYNEITDQDANIENCEYVKFSSFFTRDLDGDGYTEKYDGTCNHLEKKATLYFDINVLTDGKLENGKITINGKNFDLSTALIKDEVLKKDYIGKNTTQIELNTINYGTQKLFYGMISANINNNVNNYSVEDNKVILTGTWVSTDGTKHTEIRKEITLKTDWYGKTSTIVYPYYIETSHDIATTIGTDAVTLSFDVGYSEVEEELIIKKQLTEVTIPEFNGYAPIEATSTSQNCKYEYNKDTKVLAIERNATVSDNGQVVNTVSRNNVYTIQVKYPLEAYAELLNKSVNITFPTKGYYYGFNNSSSEFIEENPYISEASKSWTHVWQEYNGYVERFDVDVGKYVYNPDIEEYRYIVSKENPLQIYNNLERDENVSDTYIVEWSGSTGKTPTNQSGMYMKEYKTDEFLNSAGEYESMEKYIHTKGIYFSGISNILNDDGYVKVYDDENASEEPLLTITKDNFDTYTSSNPFYFKSKVNKIRVETSKAKDQAWLNVYQIKEIDDNILTNDYELSRFENIDYIYSYMTGGLFTDIHEMKNTLTDSNYAYYELPTSLASFYANPIAISNQETKNINMTINTESSRYNEAKWKNGFFVIEMPEEILEVAINDVKCNNSKVEIISYEQYEKNNKQYIKIYTKNDEEATFSINISVNVNADPRKPTANKTINLYAINEKCQNYRETSKTQDILDINGNANTTEYVLYKTVVLQTVAPSLLMTSQTLSNFDDKGTQIVSPQVAILDKSTTTRDATINVTITNNYIGTVSGTKIVGKIPFEGNKYQINGKDLGSTYSVTMKNTGIQVPEEITNIAKVYYSTNTEVNDDITDEKNNWKIKEEITDWSQVKTYAIDLSEYVLNQKDSLTFTYDIEIPGNINYNDVTYSTHAVYFCLDTEDGKLKTRTEVNRLGIMIAKKFDINFTKYKQGTNKKVKGAIYKLTGENITRTGITDAEGPATITDLYLDKEYTLKEIQSPTEYILNENEVKFKITADDEGNPEVNIISGTLKNEAILSNANGRVTLNLDVEDVAKYDIKILKTNLNTDENIKGAKFKLTGGMYGTTGRILTSNAEGEIVIANLIPGEEYTIQETKADGFYVIQEPMLFSVSRNSEGKLVINTKNENLSEASIVEEEGMDKAIININIKNKPIPTYSLNINKKNNEDEVLSGTQFKLTSVDTGNEYYGTTDENGIVTFEGLYQYIEGKYITGEYILKEIIATEGYITDSTEVKFKAHLEKVEEENILKIEILEGEKVLVSSTSNEESITFDFENKPIFRLIKKGDNNQPLAGAKFKIVDLDGNFATDSNGKPLGTLIGQDYIFTTDEEGKISANLTEGLYKAIEIEAPEGYELPENEEERTYYIGIGTNRAEETDFTVKYAKSLTGNKYSIINDIKETPDGGYIIVGDFTGELDINEDGIIDATSDGNSDMIIAKFNSNGEYEWHYTCGTNDKDTLNAIDIASDGYVAVGYELGDNLEQAVLVKIDTSGNLVWKKVFDGDLNDELHAVKVLSTGDIAVGGRFEGSYINIDDTIRIENDSEYYTGFIACFKSDGTYRWYEKIATYPAPLTQANPITRLRIKGNTNVTDITETTYGIAVLLDIFPERNYLGPRQSQIMGYSLEGEYQWTYDTLENASGTEGNIRDTEMASEMILYGLNTANIIETSDITKLADKAKTAEYNLRVILRMLSTSAWYTDSLENSTLTDLDRENYTENISKLLEEVTWIYNNTNIFEESLFGQANYDKIYIDGISVELNLHPLDVSFPKQFNIEQKEDIKNKIFEQIEVANDDLEKVEQVIDLLENKNISGKNHSQKIIEEAEVLFESIYHLDEETSEFHAIFQRVNELEVQITNDGIEDRDIEAIASELNQLKEEVNRLSQEQYTSLFDTNKFILNNKELEITGMDKELLNNFGSKGFNKENGSALIEETSIIINHINTYRSNLGMISEIANYYYYEYTEGNIGDMLSIADLTIDNDNNIIAVGGNSEAGNYMQANMIKINSENGELISNDTFGDTDGDTKLTRVITTEDGGLLLGGWTYCSNLDINADGKNDITTNKGSNDGIVIKLDENGKLEWTKTIAGTANDPVYGLVQLSDKTYIVGGYFNSPTISSGEKEDILSLQGYGNAYIVNFGNVVTAAEVPQRQEVEAVNNLKKFKITTEIDENSDNERTGGTITGIPTIEQNINFVEEIEYEKNAQNEIIITPNENYSVYSVQIDDEKINFVPDENGIVTIPVFEEVVKNHHIKVIFEENMSSITVHHYLKNRDGEYTTTSLADDEYFTGKVGSSYITTPKIDIEGYELEKNINGDYVTPTNGVGTYTNKQIEVTYYYEETPLTITIHHYLEGTENKLVDDEVSSLYKNEIYETSVKEELLDRYLIVEDLTQVNPENAGTSGTILENTTVTYYYKLKEYNITTKVEPITITKHNETTWENEEVTVKGGKISGENENPYEIVLHGKNSTKEIKAIPDEGYTVNKIIVNGEEIEFTINEDKSITLNNFVNVTENKEVVIQFAPIRGNVIVHHYIEGTTTSVPLKDGTDAKDENKNGWVNDPYVTKAKENITDKYELVDTPENASGKYIDGNIVITYYYRTIPAKVIVNHYIEGTTNPVPLADGTNAEKEVINGFVTDEYTTNYANVDKGYILVETPKNANGNMTKEDIIVNYYYTKRTDLSYTVNYLEKDTNKTLKQKKEQDGKKYLETIKAIDEIIEIDGYDYDSNDKEILVITTEENIINLYYTKRNDLSYTVNYLEKDTNKVLHEQKIQDGITFENVINAEDEVIEIDGYNYDSVDKDTLEITTGENIINIYYTKHSDLSYKVNYLEKDTNKVLHEQKVQEGMTFKDAITSSDEIIEIDGYNYDSVDKDILEITTRENVINIYYVKRNDLSYTVNYLEKDTNKALHAQKKQEEMTFGEIVKGEDEVIDIDGYKVHYVDTTELEITTGENVINIYYIKRNDLSYKVNYLEKDTNKVLKDPKVQAGMIFKDVVTSSEEVIEIDGYTYNSISPETLTITTGENVINIYYIKRADLSYTVNYLEKDTNKVLKDPKVVENMTFEDIISAEDEVANIYGYDFDSADKDELIISTKDNVINLYYTKKDTSVIVYHYKEGTTEKVAEDVVIEGKVNSEYETTIAEDLPSKYELAKAPVNATGTMTEEQIEVIYYYKLKSTKVIVHHYEEGTTNKLSEDVEIVGLIDSTYITEVATDIPIKYTLVEKPVNAAGVMMEDVIEVTYYYAVKDAALNIYYLEKNTDIELAKPEKQTGKVEEYYRTDAKEIEGYTLVENSGNTTGQLEVEPLTVIYYYLKNTKATVQYIDITTNEILDERTDEGLVGDKFVTETKTFDDYILVKEPEQKTVNMTKDEIVLKYYYLHVSGGVIEQHIDVISGDILYNDVHEGNEGDEYNIPSRTFTGYDLVEDRLPTNSEGTMTVDPVTVTYYYIHKAKVTTKYIDKITKENLREDVVETGHESDPYTTEEKEFERYKLIQVPENSNGTMTKEDIVVIYYYVPESAGVIERHLDVATDEELVEQRQYYGYVEDKYETEARQIPGYDLVRKRYPENAKGKMTKEEIVVTYYYSQRTQVHVKYVDKVTGEEIFEREVIDGHKGDEYTTEEKEIPGYDLIEVPENKKGIMNDEFTEVIYYYVKPAKVIANYYDIDTKKTLAAEEVIEGHEGDEYETVQKKIKYYNLVEIPENSKGNMTAEDNIVNYYYTKKPFNLKVEKQVKQIEYNDKVLSVNGNIGKIELHKTGLSTAEVIVTYEIKVANTGEIKGGAELVENIPNGMTMNEAENKEWVIHEDVAILSADDIEPGEERSYTVVMRWTPSGDNLGMKKNIVEIVKVDNEAEFEEVSLEDNKGQADLIISLQTGDDENNTIVKLAILAIFTILGITVTVIIRKDKNKK